MRMMFALNGRYTAAKVYGGKIYGVYVRGENKKKDLVSSVMFYLTYSDCRVILILVILSRLEL